MAHASKVPTARKYPQNLSMGLRHTGPNPDYKGVGAEKFISESNQRHYYSRWQEIMNAARWRDIHIDPITTPFEGAATMKG